MANRIQKVLEDANLKLGSVASDVLGKSGRAMLRAVIAGMDGPGGPGGVGLGAAAQAVAPAAAGVDRPGDGPPPLPAGVVARRGRGAGAAARPAGGADRGDAQPFLRAAVHRLATIPGIDRRTAEAVVAEIGTDMDRFPSSGHLASWVGLCPGNHETAGKRRSGRTAHGNPWLKQALVQAAWGASRTKGTYLAAYYRRLAARRGRKRALVALGHTLLGIIYHLLQDGTDYVDLGGDYFDRRDRER